MIEINIKKIEVDKLIDDLGLEKGYFAIWNYENKYIVAYENKIIQIVKPDNKHELHWNMKFPLIQECNNLKKIYPI